MFTCVLKLELLYQLNYRKMKAEAKGVGVC